MEVSIYVAKSWKVTLKVAVLTIVFTLVTVTVAGGGPVVGGGVVAGGGGGGGVLDGAARDGCLSARGGASLGVGLRSWC